MKIKFTIFFFILIFPTPAYSYIDPSSLGSFLSAIIAYLLFFITAVSVYIIRFYQILKSLFLKISNSNFFKIIFLFSVSNALMLNYWFLIGLPKKYFPNSTLIENWNNGLIGIFYVFLIFSLILILEKFLKKKSLKEIYFIFLIIISLNSIRTLFSLSYLYIVLITFIIFFDYFYLKLKINLRIILMLFLMPLSLLFFFILSETVFLFNNYKPFGSDKILKSNQKKLFIILMDEIDYRLAFDGNSNYNSEFLNLYRNSKIYLNLTSVEGSDQSEVGSNSILKILSPKFSLDETDTFIKNFRKKSFEAYNNRENVFSYLKNKNKNISLYGQFHPYCSIFKLYLTQCSYTFDGIYSNLDIVKINFVNQYKKIFEKLKFINFKKQISDLSSSEFNEYFSTLQFRNFNRNLEIIKNLKMGHDVYFLHLHFPSDHFIYKKEDKKFFPLNCKLNKKKCKLKDFEGNMYLANILVKELRSRLEGEYTLILFSDVGNRRIDNNKSLAIRNNVLLRFDSDNLKQIFIHDQISVDKILLNEIKNVFN